MKPSTRIIINTAASYGRSLFAIAASLFSTRWILEALGQSDFGLFGVVGSLIVMITFLNGGLQAGVTRFYAYAIGEGQNESVEAATDRLKLWFNTAFSIHLVLPAVLVLIGWPIGEYAIEHWLTIPGDRVEASLTVFRVSLVTAFMSVFSVPFSAMYMAHQKIVELSVFGILRSCAVFVLAWCLLKVSADRLIVYAYAMAGITVGLSLLRIIRAICHFPACRISFGYMYNRAYLKKLFGFVGWKTFGMSCVTMRVQGTPMLINLQFGPVVNAAYQVAFSLSAQATALSESLTAAFRPAVISAEGKGDREGMLAMAMQACKFGSLLVILFAVPLILEMQTVLELWLGNPPEFAAPICQWLLTMLIVDRMTCGHMLAVNARGKIALYELIQGAILVSALPLMWFFFKMGSSPVGVGCALFITMTFYCGGRILFAKFLLGFPIQEWGRSVAMPLIILIVTSVLAGGLGGFVDLGGFFGVVLTSVICVLTCLLSAWFTLFSSEDKVFVKGSVLKMWPKLFR
jgi:O-antigen/teichoic acid export membrane protein